MTRATKKYVSPDARKRMYEILIKAISKADGQSAVNFLTDLLSTAEREMLAKRVAIAYLLVTQETLTYRDISQRLKVAIGTVQKIASVLNNSGEGYRKIINSLAREERIGEFMISVAEKITALPTKGKGSGTWRELNKKLKKRKAAGYQT